MLAQYTEKDGLSLGGLFDNFKVKVDSYKGIIDEFKNIESFDDFLDLKTNKYDWDAISQSIKGCDETALSYFKTLDDGNGTIDSQAASVEGLGAHLKESGQSFHFAASKAALLNTALNAGIFLAASSAVQALYQAFDHYVHRVERARERTDELLSEYSQMNDTLAGHKKTVSEFADRYGELSKGVDLSNNDNLSLSTEEYEEFLDINERMAQSFPELAKGIDENGNSILALGTKGMTAKEQLEELLQTEEDFNNFQAAQGIEDVFKGVYTYAAEADEAAGKLDGTIGGTNEAIGKLQEIAESGIKLTGDDNQLIFSGETHNEAELDYMNSLIDSAREFWDSLDDARRMELSGLGIDYTTLLEDELDSDTGVFKVYANMYQLTPDEIAELENIIQGNAGAVSRVLLDSVGEQKQELQGKIDRAKNKWEDFLPLFISGMKSKQTFKNLEDPELQDIAVKIVEGLDYSYASAMEAYDPDPYAYIRDKFIVPMSELNEDDKEKLKSSFEGLLKLDAGNLSQGNQEEIEECITTIASLLGKDPLEMRVALGFDTEDIQNGYNEALKEAKRQLGGSYHDSMGIEVNNTVGEDLDDFWEQNVLTEEDWVLWKKATEGMEDATEAMEAFTEAKKKATAGDSPIPLSDLFSLKDAENNLTGLGKLSESIDTVQNAYQTLSAAIEEYKESGSLSIDTLQSIIGLGDHWLDYLVDEQGNLSLNEASLQALTNARLNDMRIQALNNVVDNVSKVQTDAEANEYLRSTNYALAESYEQVAEKALESARAKMQDAVAAGTLSQANMDAAMGKATADISKINTLFSKVAIGSVSMKGGRPGSGSKSSGKGPSSASKPSTKEIDWFETRIKELDEAIELAQTHLNNLTGSKAKNHLADTLESMYSVKQSDLRQGISMYSKMAQEELAKIPGQFRQAAQDGAFGITDFIGDGNDGLVEAIQNYRKLAEKMGDLEGQAAKLEATIRKLQVDKFKHIAEDYEKLTGITDDYRDKIQSVMDLEEAYGNKTGSGFYDSLISQTRERKKLLEEEFDTLNQRLREALSGGKVDLGSDEWQEMRDVIADVDSEIIKCSSDIEGFVNAKLELKVKEFEEIQEALDGVESSLSHYIGLLERDAVTDGATELSFTKEALAQMGLLGQQYELASEKIGLYNNRMKELQTSYQEGLLSETEYRQQLMELISAQNEQAAAMKDSKDAILDLIRGGIDEVCDAIDRETDAYQSLIDKKREALERDKEEADFQKEAAKKQEAVFAVQRQLAALGNADDLESGARRKQLKGDLLDAQAELEEWYAEHNYELQMEALDKEAEAYGEAQEGKKEALRKSLEDEGAAISHYLQEVIDSHSSVYASLQELGLLYGMKLEESITEPWRVGQDAMGRYVVSLGSQGSIFVTQLQAIENGIYGVQDKADNMAWSLINTFGLSSGGLVAQVNNVSNALSVDYGYAQSLGTMLGSVLTSSYNTSGIVSSLYSIRDAANEAAGAIGGMLVGVPTGTPTSTNKSIRLVPPGAVGMAGLVGPKYTVSKYAKGGIVTKDKKNPLNHIAEAVGEDTMIAAKEGEMVLDKDTAGSVATLAQVLAEIDAPLLGGQTGIRPLMNPPRLGQLVPVSHYHLMDSKPVNNDINIVNNNEVIINGNVDRNNVDSIQRQIDSTVKKTLEHMLRKIRY